VTLADLASASLFELRRAGTAPVVLLLSTRLRRWLFAVLIVPIIGTLLERVGATVEPRRPRLGRTVTGLGQAMRSGRRRRRALSGTRHHRLFGLYSWVTT